MATTNRSQSLPYVAMPLQPRKLKTFFLLCLILIVPLCLLVLQFHTYNRGRALSKALYETQTKAEAQEVSLRIRNLLIERVNDLEVLAQVFEAHRSESDFEYFRLVAQSLVQDEKSYHAINYVDQASIIRATVPKENEPRLLGLDLKQLPGRSEMHAEVRAARQPQASTPMILVGTYPGFVIWKPLFAADTDEFYGFLAAAIKTNDLVASVFQEMPEESQFFTNIQMDHQTIYGNDQELPAGKVREASFSVIGRTWTVQAWPKPGTALEEIQAPIYLSFSLGIVLSLLTGTLLVAVVFINSRLAAAQHNLKTSEENLRITLNSIGDAVIATDINGRIRNMNPVAEKLTGWTFAQAADRPLVEVFQIVHAQTREPALNPAEEVLKSGGTVSLANHTVLISRTGKEYQIADSGAPIRNQGGEIRGVVLVFRDVTKEYEMQEELRQSQKLQAIGQLAGGVAHDFNNMLGGIIGAAELIDLQLEPDSGLKKFSRIILESAGRASELTEKLLTFARKKAATNAPVDLHAVVGTTVDLLQRTMDPRIRVEMKLEAKRNHVDGDSSLLQNAFLNIGLNAVQAMPDGGRLQIVTREIVLDKAYCKTSRFELQPGAYIEIAFHDTGIGISAEDMGHIFEPFFTTKDQGRGTGLGLSAVYGTVQTHKGEITACSEVGFGSSFQLLLPLSQQQSSAAMQDIDTSSPVAGSGRILLVDDEVAIRETAGSLLKELGYQVVCAANGREALALFETDPDGYDAVILDMIMPEMNGKDCFAALKQIRQGVRVILSSGFTREEDLKLMQSNGLSGFVRKPYQNTELSRILAEVINS